MKFEEFEAFIEYEGGKKDYIGDVAFNVDLIPESIIFESFESERKVKFKLVPVEK